MSTQALPLGDLGPALRPHPATYPGAVLGALRGLLRLYAPAARIVLDPFGGTGKVGLLSSRVLAVSSELEPEWAEQGYRNHCALCLRADARRLPFATGSVPAICTSPAYGNRMADQYAPTDGARSHETRRTYRIALGRPFTAGNAGGMQWGEDYRRLHEAVWRECRRVLEPAGLLVVNCKDHVRDGELQAVCAWHWRTLAGLGFRQVEALKLELQGDQNTVRMRGQGLATVDHEEVVAWRAPGGRP